mgnify:CR=1 FL=1
MKKIIQVIDKNNQIVNKEVNYIPIRFILSSLLIIIETGLVILATILCTIYIPYFYIALYLTEIFCVLSIINSHDNPDYKIPWLILVLTLPIGGFMIYFMFYNRKLSKKYIRRLEKINEQQIKKDNKETLDKLAKISEEASLNARLLCNLANTHIYENTKANYYSLGEEMGGAMLEDLKKAKKFIFLEYFIIEEGKFWNSVLSILKEKVALGVEVRVIYDDIGCMMTLPGDYYKTLNKMGIKCVPFSKLKGQANNEFNNRSHRKILVIDGEIGYNGGINLADEYINAFEKYGHWKDIGVRIEGEAVNELTRLFLSDYEMNITSEVEDFTPYLSNKGNTLQDGFVIPFGDGPEPLYKYRISKTMIMTMLNQAKHYVYMTTPYLIIDNELVECIKNAALRGIDVRIITPHIPDKKLIFLMTRSYYKELIDVGVKIYEYTPGFIHAKSYISDDEVAIVGSMNLDYRSLVHHFENGIYFYHHSVIKWIKEDINKTIDKSILINEKPIKNNLINRLLREIVYTISPLL